MRAAAAILLVGLGVTLTASRARAYPQTIAKGYTTCGSCHYDPTGGGLPNSYGHASGEALLADTFDIAAVAAARGALAKNDVTGLAEDGAPALQWDVGLDLRGLILRVPEVQNGVPELMLIPMLAEVGGVLAHGPWLAYGTLTPAYRAGQLGGRSLFSRHHWLQLKLGDETSLRAGRLTLPFGLRSPDHTLYTRDDLGFDKYDQSYAVQLDHAAGAWSFSAAVGAGDPLRLPSGALERALALSVAYAFPSRASVGASALGAMSRIQRRLALSLFARVRLVQRAYVLAELAAQERQARAGDSSQRNVAGTLRAGWFFVEAAEVYAEGGVRGFEARPALARVSYGLGAAGKVLPWLEVVPFIGAEETEQIGRDVTGHVQLHVVY